MKKFICFTLFLSLLSCVTTPETNRRAFNIIPDSQMNGLGNQAYEDILKKEKLSSNKEMVTLVNKVGKRIADASGKEFDWKFVLIESETVNAFCLPGGKVAVYTGILPMAKTEAGLAAIIGHEVAHAVLKHGAERMSQGLAAQLGIAAASLSFKNEQHKQVIMASLGVGAQFGVLLPYSRKHELEADEIGMKYMSKAGYDPKEAIELWIRMSKEGGKVPEFLSTHPDSLRRAKEMEKLLPVMNGYYEKSSKQAPRLLN